MKTFEIINTKSGTSLGAWTAETASEALDMSARDAGYTGFADACKVASGDDIEARVLPFTVTARETTSGRVVETVHTADEEEADQRASELAEKWAGVEVTVRESAD